MFETWNIISVSQVILDVYMYSIGKTPSSVPTHTRGRNELDRNFISLRVKRDYQGSRCLIMPPFAASELTCGY